MTRQIHRRRDATPDASALSEALYGDRYFDEELHRDHWFRNNAAKRDLRWRQILRMLEPQPEDRVLEIGCAAGAHAVRLAPLVREIIGVDLAPVAIERAARLAKDSHLSNARFLCLDAADLAPLRDASIDKVAAIDFVEHVDDATLVRILAEVRRVLRPGGRLAVFTPCASHYVERLKARNFILKQIPGHIAVRDEAAYRRIIPSAGLNIASLYFSPSTYPVAGLLDRLLSGVPTVGALFRFRLCLVAVRP